MRVVAPVRAAGSRVRPNGLATTAAMRTGDKEPSRGVSKILRDLLSRYPAGSHVSLGEIVDALAGRESSTALVLFALPAIFPVSGTSNLCGLPSAIVGGGLVIGKENTALPARLRKRTVSTTALQAVIGFLLPVVGGLENVMKRRWTWIHTAMMRRVLGALVFALSIAVSVPMLNFTPVHAAALAIIGLGIAEHDGLATTVGVVVGAVSLTMMTLTSILNGGLRVAVSKGLKGMFRRFGRKQASEYMARNGVPHAALLDVKFADFFALWMGRSSGTAMGKLPVETALSVARGAKPSTGRSKRPGARIVRQLASA